MTEADANKIRSELLLTVSFDDEPESAEERAQSKPRAASWAPRRLMRQSSGNFGL
jgi:hypothetical protein